VHRLKILFGVEKHPRQIRASTRKHVQGVSVYVHEKILKIMLTTGGPQPRRSAHTSNENASKHRY
jgi:hypothetical protein